MSQQWFCLDQGLKEAGLLIWDVMLWQCGQHKLLVSLDLRAEDCCREETKASILVLDSRD
jgi:hypothetical protein